MRYVVNREITLKHGNSVSTYLPGQFLALPAEKAEKLVQVGAIRSAPFLGAAQIITGQGARIWIVTDPEAIQLLPPGAVYFTPHEVRQLQQAGQKAATASLAVPLIINLKEVFGSDTRLREVSRAAA